MRKNSLDKQPAVREKPANQHRGRETGKPPWRDAVSPTRSNCGIGTMLQRGSTAKAKTGGAGGAEARGGREAKIGRMTGLNAERGQRLTWRPKVRRTCKAALHWFLQRVRSDEMGVEGARPSMPDLLHSILKYTRRQHNNY